MSSSSRLARAIVVGLATAPSMVLAGTLNYTLYAGVEHSNNIALSSENPVSENVLTPGSTFQFTQMGSTFQANVAGTVEYRKYLQNHFDSQLQTQLAGQGNWTITQDRLDFSVEDYAGVQPVDQLASDSPDNQQQTNVLVMGPTLRMRFGQSARGQFELRYINSYASKVDDFDSSRGLAAFRVFRDLSPTDTISGNVEFQRVKFDNQNQDTNADYDRKEAFVRYTSTLAHFDADVLVGGSRLEFDNGRTNSAPLVRLRLGWEPTLRNSITVSGAYQYADAAQDIITTPGAFGAGIATAGTEPIDPFAGTGGLGSGTVGAGIGTGSVVIGSQVYKERRFDATWNWRSERLTVTVAPAYSKLRYVEDPTFDQNDRGLTVGIGYRIRPTLTLSGFATADKLNYETVDRKDTTVRFGLNLTRQWNRHWSGQFSVAREKRTSNAAGQDYRATSFFVGVVYRR